MIPYGLGSFIAGQSDLWSLQHGAIVKSLQFFWCWFLWFHVNVVSVWVWQFLNCGDTIPACCQLLGIFGGTTNSILLPRDFEILNAVVSIQTSLFYLYFYILLKSIWYWSIFWGPLGSHLFQYFFQIRDSRRVESTESRSKCHPEPPDVALVKLKDGFAPQTALWFVHSAGGWFF